MDAGGKPFYGSTSGGISNAPSAMARGSNIQGDVIGAALVPPLLTSLYFFRSVCFYIEFHVVFMSSAFEVYR